MLKEFFYGDMKTEENYPRKISVISMIKNAFPVSETLFIILYPVNFSKATYKKILKARKLSIFLANNNHVNLESTNTKIDRKIQNLS